MQERELGETQIRKGRMVIELLAPCPSLLHFISFLSTFHFAQPPFPMYTQLYPASNPLAHHITFVFDEDVS
jgi:hypothetical protein